MEMEARDTKGAAKERNRTNTAIYKGKSMPKANEENPKSKKQIHKSEDDDGSRAVFDDVDCFRRQG